MKKLHVSLRLPEDTIEFANKVAETNGISRSKAVELIIDITRDYFSDNQLSLEHQVRGNKDGRFKKFRS